MIFVHIYVYIHTYFYISYIVKALPITNVCRRPQVELFDYFPFSGLAHLCYWLRILGKNLNPNIETIPLGACNIGKFFRFCKHIRHV